MATKNPSKGGRATAKRAKTTARPRATAKAKPTPKRKVVKAKPAAKAKAKAAPAKPAKRRAPARAAAPKPPVRKAGADHPEVATLKARFQRERNGLEKRLTEAVREIGLLRHHELRAMQLERQVAERDATIVRLQAQLSELERRPAEPIYVREVQQTFTLITPAGEVDAAAPVDEFEDDRLGDDADLVNDDE